MTTHRDTLADEDTALQAAVRDRMLGWRDVTIATAVTSPRAFDRPDERLVAATRRDGAAGTRWLRSAAAAHELGRRAHGWLLTHNQFAPVSLEAMTRLYATSLTAAADELEHHGHAVHEVLSRHLRRHHDRFRTLVVDHLGHRPVEVVSAEHRPQLQLQVLGLGRPVGPVLDVGCGRSAALVRHLRSAGIPAVGLDRDAPGDVAVQGDWLRAEYGRACWGTVVAHLSFSLHFLHHHLAGHDVADDHARTYARILASLRPGGRFAYAPSVPAIEDVLDRGRWQVDRAAVPGTPVTRTVVTRLPRGTAIATSARHR